MMVFHRYVSSPEGNEPWTKLSWGRKVATVVLRPGHIFGALEDLDVMAADALAGEPCEGAGGV